MQAVPYRRTRLRIDGMEVGGVVDDNAWADDGYRHHDLMHLANLAVMGWSPVIRAMLGKKRRSDPDLRRVEDGARLQDIEEAVVTRIFLDVMRRFPEFDTADLLSPGALDDIRFENANARGVPRDGLRLAARGGGRRVRHVGHADG